MGAKGERSRSTEVGTGQRALGNGGEWRWAEKESRVRKRTLDNGIYRREERFKPKVWSGEIGIQACGERRE